MPWEIQSFTIFVYTMNKNHILFLLYYLVKHKPCLKVVFKDLNHIYTACLVPTSLLYKLNTTKTSHLSKKIKERRNDKKTAASILHIYKYFNKVCFHQLLTDKKQNVSFIPTRSKISTSLGLFYANYSFIWTSKFSYIFFTKISCIWLHVSLKLNVFSNLL